MRKGSVSAHVAAAAAAAQQRHVYTAQQCRTGKVTNFEYRVRNSQSVPPAAIHIGTSHSAQRKILDI